MEGKYLGGAKNRYQLICDEELDPFDILDQAQKIKELTLEDAKSIKDDPEESKGNDTGAPKIQGKTKAASKSSDTGQKVNEPLKPFSQSTEGKNQQNEDINKRASSADNALTGGEPWIECGKVKHSKYKGRARVPRRIGLEPGGVPQRDVLEHGPAPRQHGLERGVCSRRGGFNERGKREFDRHSGSTKSGVKPVEKRDGGGAHNWGSTSDSMKAAKDVSTDEGNTDDALSDASETRISKEHAKGKGDCDREGTMTLDEWKQHEDRSRSIPSYQLRKPGEGEGGVLWGNYEALKKKSPKERPAKSVRGHGDRPKPKNKQKVVLLTEERAMESSALSRRGGRGRGGRGRGRTAAEVLSDAPPAGSKSQNAPPKFDPSDFPTLGGT